MQNTILDVSDLSICADTEEGQYDIVEQVDFSLQKGEILGIVGESGCGKSMTALSIAGLLPENIRIRSGSILFEGQELQLLKKNDLRAIQGKEISMIFQEPMTSLNPLMKIGRQVSENLRLHSSLSKQEIRNQSIHILGRVGLPHPEELMNAYPHELSGGMRQRVMIAIAVVCKPKLIIADEPTTALDVTIQAQILDLLREINHDFECALLFISHDLGVISRLCNRIIVMYAGSIVEEGSANNIFQHPVHEYTKGLIGSIPMRDRKGKRLTNIPGHVPALTEKRFGCPFAPRCGEAQASCFSQKPPCISLGPSHKVRCIEAEEEREMEYAGI
ncbi:MAG: ABC transporter ATP-binding protein [Ethanoligenens sp.]